MVEEFVGVNKVVKRKKYRSIRTRPKNYKRYLRSEISPRQT